MKNTFVPGDMEFIQTFSKAEISAMLDYGQLVMRRCEVCDEPQFALPEAVRAWDDEIALGCLCQSCYWRLK